MQPYKPVCMKHNPHIQTDDTFLKVGNIARVDTFRHHRTGIMEAILAEGKETDAVMHIAQAQCNASGRVLITRLSDELIEKFTQTYPKERLIFSQFKRTLVLTDGATQKPSTGGRVAILTAGTADINVAEEAKMTAEELGCQALAIYDIGVAGISRLFSEVDRVKTNNPDVIIVAAGREGTLPTVVSGLFDVPVIAVPVSTGYGAGGGGKAALLSMLQSCSPLCVVNIDAGFIAGALAAQIANNVAAARNQKSDT